MTHLDPNRSLWLATTPGSSYPRLTSTTQADVVVGAGITGLTTALLLAHRGLSVSALEGARVASGTTGCTTAKVSSLHSLTYAQLIERMGEHKARLYAEANQAAVERTSTSRVRDLAR